MSSQMSERMAGGSVAPQPGGVSLRSPMSAGRAHAGRAPRGRAGYEVVTPLLRAGAPALLVDRGWVPFTGSRARLPDVTLRPDATVEPAAPVTLTGRIADLPSPGLASGRAAPGASAPWPKV